MSHVRAVFSSKDFFQKVSLSLDLSSINRQLTSLQLPFFFLSEKQFLIIQTDPSQGKLKSAHIKTNSKKN